MVMGSNKFKRDAKRAAAADAAGAMQVGPASTPAGGTTMGSALSGGAQLTPTGTGTGFGGRIKWGTQAPNKQLSFTGTGFGGYRDQDQQRTLPSVNTKGRLF